MTCYSRYNSPEQREKRSARASRAATIRWDKHRDSLCDDPVRVSVPEDLYRLTFDNLVTGKTEVLLFHPGTRSNNYRIDVNGRPWKVCGFSDALELIGKSCYSVACKD